MFKIKNQPLLNYNNVLNDRTDTSKSEEELTNVALKRMWLQDYLHPEMWCKRLLTSIMLFLMHRFEIKSG